LSWPGSGGPPEKRKNQPVLGEEAKTAFRGEGGGRKREKKNHACPEIDKEKEGGKKKGEP